MNPLGACAITGTGFPIDRRLTSELLGFCGPTGNTYGSIATVDYLLESTSAATVLLVGHGRFVQDLLLWGTAEFGYVRFGDGFVQGSSIMPQKRNPVAIEHARAIGSKALGQAQAIVLTVHNTPFGDIVDTKTTSAAGVRDVPRRDAGGQPRRGPWRPPSSTPRRSKRGRKGWTTLTALADTLVRDHGLPFKTAHAIAGRLVGGRQRDPHKSLAELLKDATSELLGAPLAYSEQQVAHILSPRHFVEIRRTPGGPAPEETARAAAVSRRQLEADEAWRSRAIDALTRAVQRCATVHLRPCGNDKFAVVPNVFGHEADHGRIQF